VTGSGGLPFFVIFSFLVLRTNPVVQANAEPLSYIPALLFLFLSHQLTFGLLETWFYYNLKFCELW
jgi:hypothetical protein